MSLATILAVTLAQLLDLSTFVRMIWLDGPLAEANPLVSHLLLGQGLPFVAVAKIAGLAFVIASIVVLAGRPDRPRFPRLAGLVAVAAIAAGLLGGWTNTGAILAASV